MISGKGDDGSFWQTVLSDSEYLGLSKYYPNVFFLRKLASLGFNFESLFLTNLLIQFTFLCLILIKLRKITGSAFSLIAIIAWFATSVDLLFCVVFLMRDIYIIYFLILLYEKRGQAVSGFKYLITILLFRPFAGIFGLILFLNKKQITKVSLIFSAVFLCVLVLGLPSDTSKFAKLILMPNAIYIGQEFELQDVVEQRKNRNEEGKRDFRQGFKLDMFIAPPLDILRPLIISDVEPSYSGRNGLTGDTFSRDSYDPYIVWQNLIVPLNCFYLAALFLAFKKGLLRGNKKINEMAAIYFIGSILISLLSGQGRHLLMINWLEPVLITSVLTKVDAFNIVMLGCLLTIFSITISGILIL